MPPPENSPAPRETSKARAVRIPLDYFRRPNRLTRWKIGLALAALLVPAWWLSGLGGPSRAGDHSKRLATHGPLTKAHAAWDSQCEACHVPFRPIDGSGWAARDFPALKTDDRKCQECHRTPAHHANARDEPACASCHRDHLGRDASLVALPDGQCTQCHASLTTEGRVTRFDADRAHHPEFQVVREKIPDPGTIQFNHALHLAYGMNLEKGGKPIKKWADLSESDRKRLQTQPDDPARPGVQLNCASCHRPEADGAYMAPINYENQCRSCHTLTYDGDRAMRHGLQRDELHTALEESYAAQFLANNPDLQKPDPRVGRPIPGRDDDPRREEARKAVASQVKNAERLLLGPKYCGKCHDTSAPDRGIARANVPQVWLPRAAKFDHSAHRAIECSDCHDSSSRTQAAVMLPGAGRCAECHGPRPEIRGVVAGGASNECTECHRYHQADAPPRAGLDLRQFLGGGAGKGF